MSYFSLCRFHKADETYKLGIHRSAQPLDRLKRRYKEYQARVLANEGLAAESDRQAYKSALASAMAKAQRSMLGTKSGSTSVSANSIRGQGGQAGLERINAGGSQNNARRPAVFKDADGDVFSKSKGTGAWAELGTAASRKQEKVPEGKSWKGEVLPQRENGSTPKRPVIPVYRDSDEEEETESPAKRNQGDVFARSREPSETDKLKRNPFLHYTEKDLQPKKADDSVRASTSMSHPSSSSTVSKRAPPHKTLSAAATKAHSSKPEKYAAPLHLLYPGMDLAQAGQRSSKRQRSTEVCMEELFAKNHVSQNSQHDDPWAHLDKLQGRWIPERKPVSRSKLVKRDPTVTAFTKAAQDDVMEMFNGSMANSDEESSDEESESEDENEPTQLEEPLSMMKENDAVPPTPTPASRSVVGASLKRTPFGERHQGTPQVNTSHPSEPEKKVISDDTSCGRPLSVPTRKPFGGDQTPFASKISHGDGRPQRLEQLPVADDEDSESENEGDDGNHKEAYDYMNRPMRELAPLSPITEATEYTRTTQATRTPATVRHSFTPRASMEQQEELMNKCDHTTRSEKISSLTICEEEEPQEQEQVGLEETRPRSTESILTCGLQQPNQTHFPEAHAPICPVDSNVIHGILTNLSLGIESSSDYVDCSKVQSNKLGDLQRRSSQVAKRRSSGTTPSAWKMDYMLQIADYSFTVQHKLGEGGYGAVFLAEDKARAMGTQRVMGGINGDASFANLSELDDSLDEEEENDAKLVAIKVESPPNRWEFYILGQLRARLTDEKQLSSIICARKFLCFQDESFLLLEYAEKGTLLEIVNNAVSAGVASSSALSLGAAGASVGGGSHGSAAVGIDEVLAMFFVIEVIKIVEALHSADLLHGDLKIDNCLLRLHDSAGDSWTHAYDRTGANGWSAKGILLIDFGRAIDLRQFSSEQQFVADWTPEEHDMPQIQEGHSWRHEIDYFGIASIAYCLLFGKYIQVVRTNSSAEEKNATPQHHIDRPLRRYWQVDLWTRLFDVCLNTPNQQHEAASRLCEIRSLMETWLEENCFRAGKVRCSRVQLRHTDVGFCLEFERISEEARNLEHETIHVILLTIMISIAILVTTYEWCLL